MDTLFISSSSTVILIMFQIHKNLLEGINSAWTYDHFTVTAKVIANTQHQHQLLCAKHCSKELKYLIYPKTTLGHRCHYYYHFKDTETRHKEDIELACSRIRIKTQAPIINVSFTISHITRRLLIYISVLHTFLSNSQVLPLIQFPSLFLLLLYLFHQQF